MPRGIRSTDWAGRRARRLHPGQSPGLPIVKDQQAAARTKDVQGFVATLDDVVGQSEKLNQKARALGADDCMTE